MCNECCEYIRKHRQRQKGKAANLIGSTNNSEGFGLQDAYIRVLRELELLLLPFSGRNSRAVLLRSVGLSGSRKRLWEGEEI